MKISPAFFEIKRSFYLLIRLATVLIAGVAIRTVLLTHLRLCPSVGVMVYTVRSGELASIAKMPIPIRTVTITIVISISTRGDVCDLVHIVVKTDCNCILI